MYEILVDKIGTAIVQQLLRHWLGDHSPIGPAATAAAEVLQSQMADARSRRRLVRQLEEIADYIAVRIEPLIAIEFRRCHRTRFAQQSRRCRRRSEKRP